MNDKPRFYSSTPLVPKRSSDLEPERGHQQYNASRLTGNLRARLVTLQPLHIGTGILAAPAEVGFDADVPLIKTLVQVEGRPFIPGASLKGALRSLVEALTYSCVNKTRARLDRKQYGECRYDSRHRRGELCPACQIFGSMGYQGQVNFSDSPLLQGHTRLHFIPPQYQPTGETARRHYPHALVDDRPPLWPLQVVETGATFAVTIPFSNLSPAELGLLLLALGQGEPPLRLKLGAGKSSGLGAVAFRELEGRSVDPRALYQALDATAAWTPLDAPACLEAAPALLRRDQTLEVLNQALGWEESDE